MELIIPIIALGGLFVIKRRKENFSVLKGEINKKPKENFLNEYSDPNAATDKYFNQSLYLDQTALPKGNTIQQVYSLKGDYMEANDFTHDNMVPFYRSKMASNTGVKTNETLLDNMVGSYSNLIKKTEQAPLFRPETDVNWVNGMPDMSNFYLSRTTAGTTMNNVKPFESVMVGPGLNKGFGNSGSGGYNSGMESRETWMDKGVDDLRIATNPKTTYTLDNLEGPVKSLVSNIGIQAPVNKNLPDSFYEITPDMYFTTPTTKGQMVHSEEIVKDQNRSGTSTEYTGPPTSIVKHNGYVTKKYEDPKRQTLATSDVRACSAVGKGSYEGFDTLHKSHTNYINNRSANENTPVLLNVSRTIGSILAPITDLLKPNKRDEMSKNPRIYGNGKYGVNSSYIANQYVAPTIKETTLYTPNSFQGQQNGVGGYVTQDMRTINNQRDNTTYSSFGNIGGAANNVGAKDYSAVYNQTNNELKEATTYNRTNHGNTQVFSPQMNVNIAKQEQDRVNNRQWVPSAMPQTFAVKEMMGKTYKPIDEPTTNRLDGDLLSAFKSNPYTQSLQSF